MADPQEIGERSFPDEISRNEPLDDEESMVNAAGTVVNGAAPEPELHTLDHGSPLALIDSAIDRIVKERAPLAMALHASIRSDERILYDEPPIEDEGTMACAVRKQGEDKYVIIYRDEFPDYFRLVDEERRLKNLGPYLERGQIAHDRMMAKLKARKK